MDQQEGQSAGLDYEKIRRRTARLNEQIIADIARRFGPPDGDQRIVELFARYRGQVANPEKEIDPVVLGLFHSDVLSLLVGVLADQAGGDEGTE